MTNLFGLTPAVLLTLAICGSAGAAPIRPDDTREQLTIRRTAWMFRFDVPRAFVIGVVLTICVMSFGASSYAGDAQPIQFDLAGKKVSAFLCEPSASGKFPPVILLHGSGSDTGSWGAQGYLVQRCEDLADHGFVGEVLEYYSLTGIVNPTDERDREFWPTWLDEIDAAISDLRRREKVDSTAKAGLIGFSLGASIAISAGETYPSEIGAIVDYYGTFAHEFESGLSQMPPTLILNGGADEFGTNDDAVRFDQLLTRAGRPHEIKIYSGDHHLFDDPYANPRVYKEAHAKDAWSRTIAFLEKYLKAGGS